MAKRIAVFVEGMTEQVFVQKLLIEMAGRQRITIHTTEARGNRSSRAIVLQGYSEARTQYYALICDCGADNAVASDIIDNYNGLLRQGYDLVLGLRDVHPARSHQIPEIRNAISKVLPRGKVPVHVVLAIREIEAWFIVEDRHYPSIHAELSEELIRAELGLDTATVDAESIQCPAETLHAIYQLRGRGYRKSKRHVERTVNALDYERLDVELSNRIPSLGELCRRIGDFLA